MTQLTQQLLWHSLAMSAIVLAYSAVAKGMRRRYAAKWLYLAGVIVLIGFLIPFRPVVTVPTRQMPAFLQDAAVEAAAGQQAAQAGAGTTRQAPRGFPWRLAGIAWASGMIATLLFHGIRHARFAGAVRRWCVTVQDARLLAQFEEAKRSLGIEGHDIGFARCACIHSPMLLRLGRPTVVLPEGGHVPYDLRFILLHELVHYKRRDLLVRLLMLLTIAIHWFNPAVYLLARLVTAQCEIACDEAVVRNQDMEGRHQYAMTIISVARCHARGYTLLTTYFYGGKNTMKKRINSVYEPAKTKTGALLMAVLLMLTVLAGTSIAADTAGTGTGELVFTLPEAPVKLDETLDSYVVSWAPMDGIKEYHLGVYYQLQVEETTMSNALTGEMSEPMTELWIMSGGWIGPKTIADGDGKIYKVPMGIWESETLPGDATQADISALINKHTEAIELYPKPADETIEWDMPTEYAKKEALLGCTMVITAVRDSGEPIVQEVAIPVA